MINIFNLNYNIMKIYNNNNFKFFYQNYFVIVYKINKINLKIKNLI